MENRAAYEYAVTTHHTHKMLMQQSKYIATSFRDCSASSKIQDGQAYSLPGDFNTVQWPLWQHVVGGGHNGDLCCDGRICK